MLSNGSRGARFQMNLSGESLGDERRPGRARLPGGHHRASIRARSDSRSARARSAMTSSARARPSTGSQTRAALSSSTASAPASARSSTSSACRSARSRSTAPSSASLLDEPDYSTIRAIVRLAQGTSKTTVAKLVESSSVLPAPSHARSRYGSGLRGRRAGPARGLSRLRRQASPRRERAPRGQRRRAVTESPRALHPDGQGGPS